MMLFVVLLTKKISRFPKHAGLILSQHLERCFHGLLRVSGRG